MTIKIRFEIDTDAMTVEDFLLVEDAQAGIRPFHAMAELMSRFIADDSGILVGSDKGLEILKPLKISEFTKVAEEFGEAIQRKAIPPKIS